ncbi:MAG: chemotaxis protein CheW [Bryobacterales bacterium]|nr:chemotaxis protein CheW [Bryobacterales bacterium]
MEDQEVIKDFLIESSENLARLDNEMVELEKRPKDASLLASIFRTIHTIKGTCGFLGFSMLEKITHFGENILSQVRNEERSLTPQLVSLILEMIDIIKAELESIEASGSESGALHEDLLNRLNLAYQGKDTAPPPPGEAPQRTPQDTSRPLPSVQPSPAAPSVLETPLDDPGSPAQNWMTPSNSIYEETSNSVSQAVDPVQSSIAPLVDPNNGKTPSLSDAGSRAGQEGDASASKGATAADSTIRVDVGLLDRLMNLVGELVLARNQILQFNARQEDATFNATSQRLNLITTQLQEGVMKTRMQPIGVVWNKLPRVVRDLASSCGKRIQLDMDGAETELDKSIIEAIKDPLTHLVRNSCDHGLETPAERQNAGKAPQGKLLLRAFHEGGQVNIEITDDGRGIDTERVKQKAVQKGLIRREQAERMSEREALHLIFQPGFSTAEQVTNISGRGVGMDVVKTNIEKIGGTVDLVSRGGHGTTVKIKIPLTLAIIPGLVVMSGGERFVIPQVSLLELVRLEGEAGRRLIERIHGMPVYRRRGNLLPIVYLNEALRMSPETNAGSADVLNIVILQAEDKQFGLVVDGIHDTQEIVVKPLGKQLKGLSWYAGATIMGDGKVALILDVLGLGLKSGVLSELRDSGRSDAHQGDAESERQTLLLFRSGRYERLAVPLSLVARLEEFPRGKIEHASGKMVVQYRGQILPLLPLNSCLGGYGSDLADNVDPVPVIVFADGEQRIGILVDEIVDIVEDAVVARQQSAQHGLLGSAVVGQRVTDFLDLHAVISSDNVWANKKKAGQRALHVLVAESSQFARGLVRHSLEMAGHKVIEAGTVSEALDRIQRFPVDVAAVSLDLAGGGGVAFAEQARRQIASAKIVALASGHDTTAPGGDAFDELLEKFDREGMLRSIERLRLAVQTAEQPAFAAR